MSTEPPTSFYRRPLPPHLVDLQSDEGKARFTSALCNNEADPFFPLVSNYQTQSHPAFCGLTTLSTVLNALQIDPKRVWSHPWRWFAESLLQCCLNMDNVKKVGVNIEQLATIASCQGATVHTFRHFDLEHTRQLIRKCMKHPSDQGFEFIVASYDRATLGQTGAGHFSPIAAYDSKSDSALVLDVARFKYAPHWIPLQLLVDATKPVDPSTNLPRGFMTFRKASNDGCQDKCDPSCTPQN